MAKTPKAGGKSPASSALAVAQAAVRKAQAEVARLKAEAAEEAPPADDEDDADAPNAEIEDEDDGGDDNDADAAADDAAEGDEDGDQTEAEKIAKSPEAEANPKAATAAIAAGLTYAQFRKTSAAFAGGGARRLEATLKGSPRLGADASVSGKPAASGLDPSAIYKRRAERAKGSVK